MRATFESEDFQEQLRMVKSLDMACCLFEIQQVLVKARKSMEIEDMAAEWLVDWFCKEINDVFENNAIDIHELIT